MSAGMIAPRLGRPEEDTGVGKVLEPGSAVGLELDSR
jgi:hypothetical protein